MTTSAARPLTTRTGDRLRILRLDNTGSVLRRAADMVHGDDAPMTVGAIDDIEALLPGHRTLLLPTSWLPRRTRSGVVVVLAGRALPLEAIEAALAEAEVLGVGVVVIQGLAGTTRHPCGGDVRWIETAQQEDLDAQLAGIANTGKHIGVPVIGEVVLSGLPSATRHLDRDAALVVVDSDALAAPDLHAAATAVLEHEGVPLLVVGAPSVPPRPEAAR